LSFIENTGARAVFSHLNDLRLATAPLVRFRLGTYNGTDLSDAEILHYTQNSPYVAVCLAMHLGARRIGLIGVDFVNHHILGGNLPQIELEYCKLAIAAQKIGVEILNLGAASRLAALPKLSLAQFRAAARARVVCDFVGSKALRIVSYATTPIAGVPEILARCITARTPHQATCVWATGDYGNGVQFQGGVEWKRHSERAVELLREADLVIAHNGKIDSQHRTLVETKPVITMAHNYAWNVDFTFVERGFPGVVVGQYQATLPEFEGWSVVPNPVPTWEPSYQPEAK